MKTTLQRNIETLYQIGNRTVDTEHDTKLRVLTIRPSVEYLEEVESISNRVYTTHETLKRSASLMSMRFDGHVYLVFPSGQRILFVGGTQIS